MPGINRDVIASVVFGTVTATTAALAHASGDKTGPQCVDDVASAIASLVLDIVTTGSAPLYLTCASLSGAALGSLALKAWHKLSPQKTNPFANRAESSGQGMNKGALTGLIVAAAAACIAYMKDPISGPRQVDQTAEAVALLFRDIVKKAHAPIYLMASLAFGAATGPIIPRIFSKLPYLCERAENLYFRAAAAARNWLSI
jgi:hypothetical protein